MAKEVATPTNYLSLIIRCWVRITGPDGPFMLFKTPDFIWLQNTVLCDHFCTIFFNVILNQGSRGSNKPGGIGFSMRIRIHAKEREREETSFLFKSNKWRLWFWSKVNRTEPGSFIVLCCLPQYREIFTHVLHLAHHFRYPLCSLCLCCLWTIVTWGEDTKEEDE